MTTEYDLKMEEIKQKREVDLAELTKTIYEDKLKHLQSQTEKKNNPGFDWLGYALMAGAGVAVATGVALALSPSLRESFMKLLGLGGSHIPPQQTLAPQAIIVKDASKAMASPTFSRNLRPKFSHSATQYDEESRFRKSETEALLERADETRKQTQDIAKQQENKPVKLRPRFT